MPVRTAERRGVFGPPRLEEHRRSCKLRVGIVLGPTQTPTASEDPAAAAGQSLWLPLRHSANEERRSPGCLRRLSCPSPASRAATRRRTGQELGDVQQSDTANLQ